MRFLPKRASRRLAVSIQQANVVVMDPITERAVALVYDSETMAAPIVAAKGDGQFAQEIQRMTEHDMLIVESECLPMPCSISATSGRRFLKTCIPK